jgi:hypothetical protein
MSRAVRHFDVCNGDADGLCALQQLRLIEPREAQLITGLKRDIELLRHVAAGAGDVVTVLDLSLDRNREPLVRLLAAGVEVRYFDHHFAGAIPEHRNLQALIETTPGVCTSVLVDRHLQGRQRRWAVVGAFGDNLHARATALAATAGIPESEQAVLQQLGVAINYNSYGEHDGDVLIHPRELFARLHRYRDPLEFHAAEPVIAELVARGHEDLMHAERSATLEAADTGAAVYRLPDAPWSRRVLGTFANQLASNERSRAHAVIKPSAGDTYRISVRAPIASPYGASQLCRRFHSGGGREGAGGIERLPAGELNHFVERFLAASWSDERTAAAAAK